MKVSVADLKLFGRATETALLGEHHRVRVGAILTRGRRTLHRAHNRIAWSDSEPFKPGHAERQVIDGQPAFKGTLYVARLGLNSTSGGAPFTDAYGHTLWVLPSWPCPECMEYITSCACVSKIVYHDGSDVRKVRV